MKRLLSSLTGFPTSYDTRATPRSAVRVRVFRLPGNLDLLRRDFYHLDQVFQLPLQSGSRAILQLKCVLPGGWHSPVFLVSVDKSITPTGRCVLKLFDRLFYNDLRMFNKHQEYTDEREEAFRDFKAHGSADIGLAHLLEAAKGNGPQAIGAFEVYLEGRAQQAFGREVAAYQGLSAWQGGNLPRLLGVCESVKSTDSSWSDSLTVMAILIEHIDYISPSLRYLPTSQLSTAAIKHICDTCMRMPSELKAQNLINYDWKEENILIARTDDSDRPRVVLIDLEMVRSRGEGESDEEWETAHRERDGLANVRSMMEELVARDGREAWSSSVGGQ